MEIKNSKDLLFEMMVKINPDCTNLLTETKNSGIENYEDRIEQKIDREMKDKYDKMKKTIEDAFEDGEYDLLDGLYTMMFGRKKISEHHSPQHKKKVEKLKRQLDMLFNHDYYDMIDFIENVINHLYFKNHINE